MGSQQAVLNREEMEYRHGALEVEHDWEAEAADCEGRCSNVGGTKGARTNVDCLGESLAE